jgi:hypothetical protein
MYSLRNVLVLFTNSVTQHGSLTTINTNRENGEKNTVEDKTVLACVCKSHAASTRLHASRARFSSCICMLLPQVETHYYSQRSSRRHLSSLGLFRLASKLTLNPKLTTNYKRRRSWNGTTLEAGPTISSVYPSHPHKNKLNRISISSRPKKKTHQDPSSIAINS